MKVDNGIILAAGMASRFAPLSYEKPKALIEVKGEVLIERQIRQLKEAGISEIIVVTGYKDEQFAYLQDDLGVILVHNPDYLVRNNHSSIQVVAKYLKNSYICSSDNYFLENPFENEVEESYYSAVYMEGQTNEWCLQVDNDYIQEVVIGGEDAWVMLGHVFWSEDFSRRFLEILRKEYDLPQTKGKLWEHIFIEHLEVLPMKIRRYPQDFIFEFDSLDELRLFDTSYQVSSQSQILAHIATQLGINESQIHQIQKLENQEGIPIGFTFVAQQSYRYLYDTKKLEEI